MRSHPGRTLAAALLCAAAATLAVWSGPLAAASGALHSGAHGQAQVASAHHG